MYGKLDYALMTLNKCSVVFDCDTILFLCRHNRQKKIGSNMRDYEFILNLEISGAHGVYGEQVHYREFCVVLLR